MTRIRSRAGKDSPAWRRAVGRRATMGGVALVALLGPGWDRDALSNPIADEPDRPVSVRDSSTLGPVPDLRGEPIDRAAQLALLSGRQAEVGFWPIPQALWRAELDPRKVGAQFPEPGSNWRRGSTWTAGATMGLWRFVPADPQAESVVVPDLTERPWDQARAEASQAGLVPFGPTPGSSGTKVVAQHPRAGLTVVQGVSILLLTRSESRPQAESLPPSPASDPRSSPEPESPPPPSG